VITGAGCREPAGPFQSVLSELAGLASY
jgi:hypothetical protein